ncbi:MAG: hypothetical protein GWN58_44290 [Anaerolineae bacterium]|nr:hypothetical protein [Anaerolineae bacterium]
MTTSNHTFQRLRQELREIQGERTYQAMADECGLKLSTLWRIINGERRPYGETLDILLAAYPQLARVFLPPDVPNGTVELPETQSQGEPA